MQKVVFVIRPNEASGNSSKKSYSIVRRLGHESEPVSNEILGQRENPVQNVDRVFPDKREQSGDESATIGTTSTTSKIDETDNALSSEILDELAGKSKNVCDTSDQEVTSVDGIYGESFWVGDYKNEVKFGPSDVLLPQTSSSVEFDSHQSTHFVISTDSLVNTYSAAKSTELFSGAKPSICSQVSAVLKYSFKPQPQTSRLKTGLSKMLPCSKCQRSYRNLYSLEHHICHPRGKNALKLGKIPCAHLGGVRYYFCPECRKPFKWLGNLTRHYNVHTGTRFFKCEICSKAFFTAYQVKRHMNSHLGVRYKCSICSKPFTCKYACTWHTRQHFKEKKDPVEDEEEEDKFEVPVLGQRVTCTADNSSPKASASKAETKTPKSSVLRPGSLNSVDIDLETDIEPFVVYRQPIIRHIPAIFLTASKYLVKRDESKVI